MIELIVCLTNEVGQKHIKSLIEGNEWEKVILLTNDVIAHKFQADGELNMILINSNQTTEGLVKEISQKLKGNISGMEVALNFFSGNGKEHMAIVAALLNLGVAIRLVKQGKNGFEEI